MSAINLMKPPYIVEAGPFPGVYTDFASYKSHCELNGVNVDLWFTTLLEYTAKLPDPNRIRGDVNLDNESCSFCGGSVEFSEPEGHPYSLVCSSCCLFFGPTSPKSYSSSDECPNALLPDGPICPRCRGRRGESGIDGGSWVHY